LPHQEQIHADKLGELACPISRFKRENGITLRHRDYTIDRLEVMAQKAGKMPLKIINEGLCNVQLFAKV